MDITFEQINAFHEVVRQRSFSRAGEKLFRSQSAVSIQIANLEDATCQKLFNRTTKSIELTEAGEILLRYVIDIKRLLEEAEKELKERYKLDADGPVIEAPNACITLDTKAENGATARIHCGQEQQTFIEISEKGSITIHGTKQGEISIEGENISIKSPNKVKVPSGIDSGQKAIQVEGKPAKVRPRRFSAPPKLLK